MTLATMGVSIIWALAIGFALPKLEFYTLQALITVIFGGGALFGIVVRPDPQVARLMLNIVLGFWFLAFEILFMRTSAPRSICRSSIPNSPPSTTRLASTGRAWSPGHQLKAGSPTGRASSMTGRFQSCWR